MENNLENPLDEYTCNECRTREESPAAPYGTDSKGGHICNKCIASFSIKELPVYC